MVEDECRKPRLAVVAELFGRPVEIVEEDLSLLLGEFWRSSRSVFVVWSLLNRLLRKPIEPAVDRLPGNVMSLGQSRLRITLLVGDCRQDTLCCGPLVNFRQEFVKFLHRNMIESAH